MSNIDTVKSVTANIENIITGLGYALEDLSTDPEAKTTPACQLFYRGEDPGDPYRERNKSSEINFLIKIEISDKHPDSSRDKQKQGVKDLKAGITPDTLNVGDLAASKLVSWVTHPTGEDLIDYNPPMSTINYLVKVRYRET